MAYINGKKIFSVVKTEYLQAQKNYVDLMSWENGSINTDGSDTGSVAIRVRCNLFQFPNNVKVYRKTDQYIYNVFVFTKDSNNNYTCISFDDWQKETCILNCELYYRFVVRRKDNGVLTATDVMEHLVIEDYSFKTNEPKPIIIDTDWWTDSDDSLAIRTLLWAEKKGMVDIVGININATTTTSVTSLARVIDSEGRPNFSIGYDNEATDYTGSPSYHQTVINNYSSYSIYDENTKAQECVAYYRRALISIPKGMKCNIISVGYLNALSKLLNSTADKYSSKSGLELMQEKVDTIYIMGGAYPNGSENNFNRTQRAITAAQNVVNSNLLPIDIKFLGYEMGDALLVGGTIKDTIGTDDLLYKILYAHGGQSEAENGRDAWDPLTVLYACMNNKEKMFFNEIQGINVVNNDGSNTFTNSTTGRHYYCTKKKNNSWYQYILNTILNLNDNSSRNDIGRLNISPHYNEV